MLLRAPGSSQSWAPKCPWAHPSELPPSPSQGLQSPRGSQEPGKPEAAESAARGPGPGLGRKGGGQAAGLRLGARFLPATPPGGSMGLDLSRGPGPWPGRCLHCVTTPPPQPFPRRRNQGGGARPAGLGARLQLETLLLPPAPPGGWGTPSRGSSFESLKRLPGPNLRLVSLRAPLLEPPQVPCQVYVDSRIF